MTYPTPLRPASGDQTAPLQERYLDAASWPDLLQLASETGGSDVALVEQILRRTETKQ